MALLSFIPGLLAVGALLAAGLSRQECFLVYKPLSWAGFAVLVGVFVLGQAAVLPVSVWQGWNWCAALLLAPASGISQELFFRSALLPVMAILLKGRSTPALLAHAMLFAAWHIGPLFVGAPWWAVLAVLLVAFLAGLGWGWQVQRDGTVVWAMLQHSLFWVVGMQFALVA